MILGSKMLQLGAVKIQNTMSRAWTLHEAIYGRTRIEKRQSLFSGAFISENSLTNSLFYSHTLSIKGSGAVRVRRVVPHEEIVNPNST